MRVGLAERTECFGKGGMAGAVSLLAECESMKSRAGSGCVRVVSWDLPAALLFCNTS